MRDSGKIMFSTKMINRLRSAYHVTVLTGAGISAESGVPTFRGNDGLWNKFDADHLATPEGLLKNNALLSQFFQWKRTVLSTIKPNLGHYALVDLENRYDEFTLITQNMDNLHSLAGNKNLLELHGNLTRSYCVSCGEKFTDQPDTVFGDEIPKCVKCGGMLHPDIVLFGEPIPDRILKLAQEASATCEVFFSIGTSGFLEPAASLPYIAKANGSFVVEVSATRTQLSDHADEFISGQLGKVLPLLVIMLEKYQ